MLDDCEIVDVSGRFLNREVVPDLFMDASRGPAAGLSPDEPGYPFQALVDAARAHAAKHGRAYKIAESWVLYLACGHKLPAAIAIDVTEIRDEDETQKAEDGFAELASQLCPECARLAKS